MLTDLFAQLIAADAEAVIMVMMSTDQKLTDRQEYKAN
jgi:hypothetical protein